MKTMNYDKENDMFAVHNGFSKDEDFEANLEIGDLILDISTKKRIVGIEIMDANKYLEKLKIKNVKEVLENIEDFRLDAKIKKENIDITLLIITKSKKEMIVKILAPVPKSVFR